MLGLAFAVATVSLNHLLRSGIWATCTLENQETEGKGGGRERQGLKMRWREQCHSCHMFFWKWLHWFGQFAHLHSICQIWLWRRWLNVWPKRRRKEKRRRNGQLPSCYCDQCTWTSMLDITRKSAHRFSYETHVLPDVASVVQMVWLQICFELWIQYLRLGPISSTGFARLWLDGNDWLWELQCLHQRPTTSPVMTPQYWLIALWCYKSQKDK